MHGIRIGILIEMHGVGCQIGIIVNTIICDGTLGAYAHMVWILIITYKIPHPTRTGTCTTVKLLTLHGTTIDVHVAITVTVRIDCLYFIFSQLIITILQIVTVSKWVEELQHVLTLVEVHNVVHVIGNVDVIVAGFGYIDNIIVATYLVIVIACYCQFLGFLVDVISRNSISMLVISIRSIIGCCITGRWCCGGG